jgi:hypothetical protein
VIVTQETLLTADQEQPVDVTPTVPVPPEVVKLPEVEEIECVISVLPDV